MTEAIKSKTLDAGARLTLTDYPQSPHTRNIGLAFRQEDVAEWGFAFSLLNSKDLEKLIITSKRGLTLEFSRSQSKHHTGKVSWSGNRVNIAATQNTLSLFVRWLGEAYCHTISSVDHVDMEFYGLTQHDKRLDLTIDHQV